jgi:hypothetical protein
MKYAIEMGSGAMIYIRIFIKIGLGIRKFMGRGFMHRHTGDLANLLLFFQNKGSRPKRILLAFKILRTI